MTPDQVEAVAAQAYVEMLEAGFTRVGEFHYLHHAPDGRLKPIDCRWLNRDRFFDLNRLAVALAFDSCLRICWRDLAIFGVYRRKGSSPHIRLIDCATRSDKRALGLPPRSDCDFVRRVFGVALTGRFSCANCGRQTVGPRRGCGQPLPIGRIRGH